MAGMAYAVAAFPMAKPFNLHLARVRPPHGESPADESLPVPEPALPARVLEVAASCAARGIGGAMGTILERHGSAPSTPGQKIWVGADRSCVGTVGGGAVEREILAALARMAEAGDARHELRSFKLGAELGMCCGGQVTALLEPIAGLVPCLIVGGGHVATALAPLLARVGFAVTVVDDRDAWGREGRIPGVTCIVGEYDDVGSQLPRSGVVLVMSHDHGLDQQAIEWGIRQGFAFVGGVGSRAKAQRTRDRLSAKGFTENDVRRVRMPLGVPIGARLPDELATSIAAELIAWRRGRSMP
jgi:xanthine dehydrogenase accessory factor